MPGIRKKNKRSFGFYWHKSEIELLKSGADAMELDMSTYVKLLTIRNAASRLGVHYNTVLKYVKAGRLNPIMGSGERAIGISEESFERFLEGKGNEKKSQIR